MNLQLFLSRGADRIWNASLAALIVGTALAFGGAVWWARPVIAALTALFVLSGLLRLAVEREVRVLKSPLTALGVLALGLATAQLVPLPAALAKPISPRSHDVYAHGVLTGHASADDPTLVWTEPARGRSPVSVDRPVTLRWLAGATVCLALFWGVSQFTDRLARLYLVWGCIVAAYSLNTTIAVVQLVSRSGGLYGFVEPGKGPAWGPSVTDLLSTPNASILRTLGETGGAHPAWAVPVPDRPFLVGTLMGGPGAYLALGSIGLPLALALVLQMLAPRGSRERLAARLGESGQGSLVFLLFGLLMAGAALVGMMAGPLASLPFVLSLFVVGIGSARPSGLRWVAVGLTLSAVLAVGAGVAGGRFWAGLPGDGPPVKPVDLEVSSRVWLDSLRIARDFPVFGTGLGSFASIYPYYKSRDPAQSTASSSLLQWGVESGAVGLGLLLIGCVWCLVRLPGAVRRVGTADRSLAYGLIGAASGFSLYAAAHWSVELPAVAVAASALGGTWNRWLAGGTDLFVERG